MSAWLWIMAAGSAVVFALYGLRCAKAVRLPELRKHAWETALLSFVFAAVFGLVLARAGYALLMQELDFEYDGLAAFGQLLEIEIDRLSFLGGAIFMILCDMISRTAVPPNEIAVGAITQVTGAPFFLYLLWKERACEGHRPPAAPSED